MFPLINALGVDNGHWLHWRTQDTLETLCAWFLLSLLVAATIGVAAAFARFEVAEAVTAAWLLIGAFFFFGGIVKTGVLQDVAARYRLASPWIAVGMGAFLGLLMAMAPAGAWRRGKRPFRRATLILSPLTLVFAFQVGNAQWHAPRLRSDPSSGAPGDDAHPHARRARVLTLVLLFDELSPDYLYGSENAGLARLPALSRLLAESMLYTGAYLPGGETRFAIPALFGASAPTGAGRSDRVASAATPDRPSTGGSWLKQSVNRGYDVRVLGWYLDYCDDLAAAASRCKSVSIYNPRTLDSGFSMIDPLWMTLNLLPSDRPFGTVKMPAARRLHEATYASTIAWVNAQLADDRADVIYAHVNVPHVPFLDPAFVGAERFTVTKERYVRQLQYVDAFVDGVAQTMSARSGSQRPMRLIVMSDHNVRSLAIAADHDRVTFIVRAPDGEKVGTDQRRRHAADLLAEIIEGD